MLVTTDLLGLPRALTSEISEYANKSYSLRRDQILFNSSHTHTGPVVKNSPRSYDLDATQSALIEDYTSAQKQPVEGHRRSDQHLSPAKLSFGKSTAQFAMNRRQFDLNGVVIGVNLEGAVDREVPAARRIDGWKAARVVFGYACHNTTLTESFMNSAAITRDSRRRWSKERIRARRRCSSPDAGPTSIRTRAANANWLNSTAKRWPNRSSRRRAALSSPYGAVKSVIGGVMIPFDGPPTKEEFSIAVE